MNHSNIPQLYLLYHPFHSSSHQSPCLRIDTLGISINLQPLLRHLRIPQEIQRHPNQMPLDLIQFRTYLVGIHKGIMQMALFEFAVAGEKSGVVVEGFD